MTLVLFDCDGDEVNLFESNEFDSIDGCMEDIKNSFLEEGTGPTVEYMPWTLQDQGTGEVHAVINKIYLSIDAEIRGK